MSLGQNVKGGTYETFLSHTMRVGSKTNDFELGIPVWLLDTITSGGLTKKRSLYLGCELMI